MSGLKIYLRSSSTQWYRWSQFAVAGVLLANAVFQLKWIHAPIGKPAVCFALATLLVVGATVGNKYRRKFRYLPGLLIAISSSVLIWNTWDEVMTSDLPWPLMFYILGFLMLGWGLSQFFTDGVRWMSVSSRSVRLKRTNFSETRHPWDTIEEVTVEERDIMLLFKNGSNVRVRPEPCDMQHLRSRIDLIYKGAHSGPAKTEKQGNLMQDMFGA